MAQLVKNLPAMWETPGSIPGSGRSPGEGKVYLLQYSCLENPRGQRSLVGYSPWGRKQLYTTEQLHLYPHQGFPGASDSKEYSCNAGDLGSIPGLGRSPGARHDNPLQYSCLENPRGQRSLATYSPWGCKELNTTERLSTAQHIPTPTV